MGLDYYNLDERTRSYMVEEINMDVANNTIYLSSWLTESGQREWPSLLRSAAEEGNDDSLAAELAEPGRLRETAERRKPTGGYTIYKVPVTAPHTMAEGEFNRFYVRGLCRRALDDGIDQLVIYRAKEVKNPRPESERKIGTTVDARAVLDDLRATPGVEPALGLPPGPNSGLTARLP